MSQPDFDVVFATTGDELRAAQALRYDVFVRELGGDGPLVDHNAGLEIDSFDKHSKHLLLLDRARSDDAAHQVVGVYRLLDAQGAQNAGGFYSAREFDLAPLIASKRALLELGRSCLHRDYRGGMAMYYLWSKLARYVLEQKVDVLFGVASFHGTDPAPLTAPLTLLHQRHLASQDLRPIAQEPCISMAEFSTEQIARKDTMMQIPALIKAYLRLGGCIGQGAYLDHTFNTTDVCLVLDVSNMSEKQRRLYSMEHAQ
ncbi:GNAT family N-acetyltransferase [Planktotalea sp.]|uniref:GNAT family N-acetyltransferase n=1 Tax=Planktotalea sp. TaxID=2029877 RepID=UPI003D6BD8F4